MIELRRPIAAMRIVPLGATVNVPSGAVVGVLADAYGVCFVSAAVSGQRVAV
jgi:hypothetical protein